MSQKRFSSLPASCPSCPLKNKQTKNINSKIFPLVSIRWSCKSRFALLEIVVGGLLSFFLLGFHELLQWWSSALAAGITFVTKSFAFQLHFPTLLMPTRACWWWEVHPGTVALGLGHSAGPGAEMLRQRKTEDQCNGGDFLLNATVFFKLKKKKKNRQGTETYCLVRGFTNPWNYTCHSNLLFIKTGFCFVLNY